MSLSRWATVAVWLWAGAPAPSTLKRGANPRGRGARTMFGTKEDNTEDLDLKDMELPTLDDESPFELVDEEAEEVEFEPVNEAEPGSPAGDPPEMDLGDLEHVEEVVNHVTARIESLQDELTSALQEEVATLRETYEGAVGSMRERIEEAQGARDEVLEELTETREELGQREDALADLRHELTDLREDLEDRQVRVAELEMELEDREASVAELETELHHARSKLLNINDIVGVGGEEDAGTLEWDGTSEVSELGNELPEDLLANVEPMDDE